MDINPRAPLVARRQVFIQASPEAVWNIQTDIDGWRDWQPDIARSKLDGALVTGCVFRWTSGGFPVTSTVHEVELHRRLAWTGRAFGSRARHVWGFTPQNGGTLVTTEESMEGWLITLLKPLMPRFLDKSLDVWMKSLKEKAERLRV
jgi:uncharacterized protein YndB with AHSA1/START domain